MILLLRLIIIFGLTFVTHPARAGGCAEGSINKIFSVVFKMTPGLDEVLKCQQQAMKCRKAPFTGSRIAWADATEAAVNFRGDVERVKATCSMINHEVADAIIVLQKFVKKRILTPPTGELFSRLGDEFFHFDRVNTENDINKCVNLTKSGFDKPEGDVVHVNNVSCVVRALADDGEGNGQGYDISLCVGACDVAAGFTPR